MTTAAPIHAEPRAPGHATIAEWLAQPEERGAELLRGRIVYKALPAPEHGRSDKIVRAEPFDALELRVGLLFGDEEEEAPDEKAPAER